MNKPKWMKLLEELKKEVEGTAEPKGPTGGVNEKGN